MLNEDTRLARALSQEPRRRANCPRDKQPCLYFYRLKC